MDANRREETKKKKKKRSNNNNNNNKKKKKKKRRNEDQETRKYKRIKGERKKISHRISYSRTLKTVHRVSHARQNIVTSDKIFGATLPMLSRRRIGAR